MFYKQRQHHNHLWRCNGITNLKSAYVVKLSQKQTKIDVQDNFRIQNLNFPISAHNINVFIQNFQFHLSDSYFVRKCILQVDQLLHTSYILQHIRQIKYTFLDRKQEEIYTQVGQFLTVITEHYPTKKLQINKFIYPDCDNSLIMLLIDSHNQE